MTQAWALQDAKAHFSEVVKKAKNEGPQVISVRGNPTVVILSQVAYNALIASQETLVDFFQRSPLRGVNFAVLRDKSFNRDIEL